MMKHEVGIVRRVRRTGFVKLLRTSPPKTVCPNFYILAHADGCPFRPSCAYCYLKASLWRLGKPHLFVNVARMEREIIDWINSDGLQTCVLNSGNLSDSLSFESERPVMARLVEIFRVHAEARRRPHSLLIVTKGGTEQCRPLLETKPCANVIVSFSVNNPAAARRYEAGAPPVADRLDAARRLRKAGWRVRIRLDPMIAGFDYRRIALAIRRLEPERITLGTLRAEPSLYRFAGSALFRDLERPPRSAKGYVLARYPRETRVEMYRQVIRIFGRGRPIGLCEETRDVWLDVGLEPDKAECNCGA